MSKKRKEFEVGNLNHIFDKPQSKKSKRDSVRGGGNKFAGMPTKKQARFDLKGKKRSDKPELIWGDEEEAEEENKEGGGSDSDVAEDDSEDEEEGGPEKSKDPNEKKRARNREVFHLARLQKQGIELAEDADSRGVDEGTELEEGYSEHYLGSSSVRSSDFRGSGRASSVDVARQRSDEREERRKKMEVIFNKKDDNLEPFTMKGQVTAEGQIIEDRKEEVIQDAWFDEWKEKSEDKDYHQPVVSDEKVDEDLPTDPIKLRYILRKHMNPGETVLQALRRLGSNQPYTAPRKKNLRKNQNDSEETVKSQENDDEDDDDYDWRAAVQNKSSKKNKKRSLSNKKRGYDFEYGSKEIPEAAINDENSTMEDDQPGSTIPSTTPTPHDPSSASSSSSASTSASSSSPNTSSNTQDSSSTISAPSSSSDKEVGEDSSQTKEEQKPEKKEGAIVEGEKMEEEIVKPQTRNEIQREKAMKKKQEDLERIEKIKRGEIELSEEQKEKKEQKKLFDELTEAANRLLQMGEFDVYQDTYEKINSHLTRYERQQEEEAEKKALAKDKPQWEYKWSEADVQIHGPYTADEMTGWRSAGYFSATNLRIRRFIPQQSADKGWVKTATIRSFHVIPTTTSTPTTSKKNIF